MAISLLSFLDQLVAMEELAHNFYVSLGRLIQDEKSKMVLSYMAMEELNHRDLFLSWKASGGGSLIFPESSLDLPEMVKVPEADVTSCCSPMECLTLAIRFEDACIQLYRWLADLQPEGKEKQILERIIAEEEAHKKQYEALR